jgi:uncharacterized protein Yka (UPF0111/DUF47 family)
VRAADRPRGCVHPTFTGAGGPARNLVAVRLFGFAGATIHRGEDRSAGLLHEIGANVEQVTALLRELIASWPESRDRQAELVEAEHAGDRLVHALMRDLYRAPASTRSRDLHTLTSKLDDIVDYAEEAGDLMVLYRIEAPMDEAVALAEVLQAAGREVAATLADLADPSATAGHVAEIDRLEKEGDRLEREALSGLFDSGIDPLAVIRWKDVYDRIERGIDSCNSVAQILQGISIKRAR